MSGLLEVVLAVAIFPAYGSAGYLALRLMDDEPPDQPLSFAEWYLLLCLWPMIALFWLFDATPEDIKRIPSRFRAIGDPRR